MLLAWSAQSASAQPKPALVQTRDGVSLSLPAGYRDAPELAQQTSIPVEVEHAFTDASREGTHPPVHMFVLRVPELATARLPLVDADSSDHAAAANPAVQLFTEGLRRALKLHNASDITTSGYDAERAALWATFRQSEASFDTTFTSLGFFTNTALVLVVVASETTRAQDAAALVNYVYRTSSTAPGAQPLGTGASRATLAHARDTGGVLGAISGSLLGVVLFGVLLGLGLQRFGLSAQRAAAGALLMACAPVVMAALLSKVVTTPALTQLTMYPLGAALVFRPLVRWLERRAQNQPPRSGTLADASGLSTLEYALLFVIICIGCIAVWAKLGNSLDGQVSTGNQTFNGVLDAAKAPAPSKDSAPPTSVSAPGVRSSGSPAAASSAIGSKPASTTSTGTTRPQTAAAPSPATAAANSQTKHTPAAVAQPQSWKQSAVSLVTDNATLRQFTEEHPVLTTIVKEATVIGLESAFPVVGVVNAVRTLTDDKAAGWEKALAAAEIVSSVAPPIAAGLKAVRRGVKSAEVIGEAAQAIKAIDHATDIAHAAHAADEAADALRAVDRASDTARAAHDVAKVGDEAADAVRVAKRADDVADTTKAAASAEVAAARRSGAASEPIASASNASALGKRGSKELPMGLCFTANTLIATANGPVVIEDVRFGDRVLTHGEDRSVTTAVDAATWHLVRLELPNPSASTDVLEIELLRPLTWIDEHHVVVGARIDFVLEEMALEGPALVVSVEPCPEIESSAGRVVLATVTHLNAEVLELRFDGSSVVLEPTARHRLYSLDRADWVAAGELVAGELLGTSRGFARIASIAARDGVHRVYNLEVETDHSYLASALEVLSHNENHCADPATRAASRLAPSPMLYL